MNLELWEEEFAVSINKKYQQQDLTIALSILIITSGLVMFYISPFWLKWDFSAKILDQNEHTFIGVVLILIGIFLLYKIYKKGLKRKK